MSDPGWQSSRRGGSGGRRPGRDAPTPGRGGKTRASSGQQRRPEPSQSPAARPRSAWFDDDLDKPTSRRAAGGGGWARLTGKIALGVVSMLVLGLSGYAWAQYNSFDSGLRKSHILEASGGKDTNILIMGLDSRLDENGNPLPQDIYNALQAGNQNDGGNNSNVLMLLHVPGDGSKATSISIPRDDYVNFPGCPDKQCAGKIKEAYGLAFAAKHDQLVSQGGSDKQGIEQQSRDAGRQAEIDTVQQFLGGVPVNHFVEVTMVAFFQIAQVVQPITVCLNEDTHDTFSGANFHKGVQQINAQQAVEFVRQRRDPNTALNFTDLDRERRQQAFISSLAYQLKQAGTFSNPGKLQGILAVGKQNIAVDDKLNLLDFAQQASNLTSGNIQFVTLPIDGNATRNGEDVNLVDIPKIQAVVRQYLGGGPSAVQSAPGGQQAPSKVTVDVANASGHGGWAADVEHFLTGKGYTEGTASTDDTKQTRSAIYYSGDPAAANALSGVLGGMRVQQDSSLAAGHLKVVLGTDFSLSTLNKTSSDNTPAGGSAAAPAGDVVSAFAGEMHDQATPVPTPSPDISSTSVISGGGIPCVK